MATKTTHSKIFRQLNAASVSRKFSRIIVRRTSGLTRSSKYSEVISDFLRKGFTIEEPEKVEEFLANHDGLTYVLPVLPMNLEKVGFGIDSKFGFRIQYNEENEEEKEMTTLLLVIKTVKEVSEATTSLKNFRVWLNEVPNEDKVFLSPTIEFVNAF